MPDIYRGFEVERECGVFTIRERGKLIDDAASETRAYDKIDKILLERRAEDQAETNSNHRR